MKSRNVSALLALGLAASVASADMITFDEGGPGPNMFALTTPLSGAYMGTGVVFTGPGIGLGGAILNDSTWLNPALSGVNFLAFNVDSSPDYPVGPETITFSSAMASVAISVNGQGTPDSFLLQAYDASDTLIGTDFATASDWKQLSVNAAGIKKIILASPVGDGIWTADNLVYTPVPLPTTAALAALGAGATLIRRRRAAKAS